MTRTSMTITHQVRSLGVTSGDVEAPQRLEELVRRFAAWFVVFSALVVINGAHGGVALKANQVISVSIWPDAPSHGHARVKVFVERDEANRWLTWEVDGPDFYRSSTLQLDGKFAPVNWLFTVRGLPEGEFAVRATVKRNNDTESVASAHLVVLPGYDTP